MQQPQVELRRQPPRVLQRRIKDRSSTQQGVKHKFKPQESKLEEKVSDQLQDVQLNISGGSRNASCRYSSQQQQDSAQRMQQP
jgi:hypothetical protein